MSSQSYKDDQAAKELRRKQKLEALIAERDQILEEMQEVKEHLNEAEKAVMEERIALSDIEPFKVGDIVLVPRKLFGQIKWWPAKVNRVHATFDEGDYKDDGRYEWSGTHWETLNVGYGVTLQTKDGAFTGGSDSFYHNQVQAMPAEADG